MASQDKAHQLTDKNLAVLEKRIARIYREAQEDLQQTVQAYFESFQKRDEEMKTQMNAGEITKEQYGQWRLAQIGRGKRFEALRDKMAQRYTKANETAMAYINDATPGIYSLNRNYTAYTIEQAAGNVGFTLFDEQTEKRLITEEPDLMPNYPKEKALKRNIDLNWGKKQITASVTSSILQGKSIRDIASDLQRRLPEMNRASAVRAARTSVTGAQNAGRLDSYEAAAKKGIELQKEWTSTLDGRTRHSHRRLDGEVVDYDAEFSNGCRYPGDPRGKPAEVYNCRCTMVAKVKDVDASDAQRRARDPRTGRNMLINQMTYDEWKEWVQNRTYSGIIGKKTLSGIEIKSVSAHSIDRGGERGVTLPAVADAITKPLYVSDIKIDGRGKRSQRFIGKEATVNVNPDTGNIVTVWKTGKRERIRYGGNE